MCRATNLPWVVDGRTRWPSAWGSRGSRWSTTSTPPRWASPRSARTSWSAFGGGPPVPHGPIAVLGAGTGLGQAFLLWSRRPTMLPGASPPRAGTSILAARTPLELGLVQFLITKYGRVSCERVLSGHGLVDVFTFLSEEPACRGLIRPETAGAARPRPGTIRRRRSRSGRWRAPIRSARWRCQFSVPSWARWPATWRSRCWRRAACSWPGGIAPRDPELPQARGLPRGVRPQGAPAHAGRTLPAFIVTHPQPGLMGAAKIAAGSNRPPQASARPRHAAPPATNC